MKGRLYSWGFGAYGRLGHKVLSYSTGVCIIVSISLYEYNCNTFHIILYIFLKISVFADVCMIGFWLISGKCVHAGACSKSSSIYMLEIVFNVNVDVDHAVLIFVLYSELASSRIFLCWYMDFSVPLSPCTRNIHSNLPK